MKRESLKMGEYETFPSFNFFARDWFTGTVAMTPEQKGMFIDLLAAAWEQSPPCTLPNDDTTLAKIAGVSAHKWRKSGLAVRSKFDVIDGRLRNRKLWSVYEDMVAFRERKRTAGKKGNEARWGSQRDSSGIARGSLPAPTPLEPSIEGSFVPTERTDALVTDITSRMGRNAS